MFDPIALPEWLADGVLFSSFCVHGGLFLFLYNQHKSVRDGCTQVSLFHHAIAFVVGLYCSYLYIDDIVNRPTLKPNDLFPWTQWLTRFNAGYFFYDSIHVCIWDQVFIPHHFVVLVGLIGTDVGNVTALTNSVNTWMTEIGSLLYNMYVYHKSETTYLIFLVSYAASRFVLAGWSCYVFYDIWSHIFAGTAVPGPYAAAFYCSLQVLLLGSNAHFLWMHYTKFTNMRAKQAAKALAKEQELQKIKEKAEPQNLSKVLKSRDSEESLPGSAKGSAFSGESDSVEAILREYSRPTPNNSSSPKESPKHPITDTLLTSSIL